MNSTAFQLALLGLGAATTAAAATLAYYINSRKCCGCCKKESNVIPIDDLAGTSKYTKEEREARCHLAALYRVVDKMGLTDQIYNHISVSCIDFLCS